MLLHSSYAQPNGQHCNFLEDLPFPLDSLQLDCICLHCLLLQHPPAVYINRMTDTVTLRISQHHDDGNESDKDEGTCTNSSRKDGKEIVNLITRETDKIAQEMVFLNKCFSAAIGLGITLFMLMFISQLISISTVNESLWFDLITLGATLGMLSATLSTTLAPSLAWTQFIYRLRRPNTLFILSECCFNKGDDLQQFFVGLELQREFVVWNIFGISVTIEVYQRILGSFISLLVIGGSVFLRTSNLT